MVHLSSRLFTSGLCLLLCTYLAAEDQMKIEKSGACAVPQHGVSSPTPSHLHATFGKKDTKVLMHMLAKGHTTLLHITALKGNMDKLEECIERGYAPDQWDNFGQSSLHYASDAPVVRFFVYQCSADKYIKNKWGNYPIHQACLYGNLDVVRCWIEEMKVSVNVQGDNKMTPLHAACASGNIELVTYLIDKGGQPNSVDVLGNTPLHYSSSAPVSRYLITTCKAAKNKPNKLGNTPLHRAIASGYKEVAQCLIDSGIDANTVNLKTKATPLHKAVISGDVHMLDYLLKDTNADPCMICTRDGKTAWHCLSENPTKKRILRIIKQWSARRSKNQNGDDAYCPGCRKSNIDEKEYDIANYYCLHFICKTCKDTIKKHAAKGQSCPCCKKDIEQTA